MLDFFKNYKINFNAKKKKEELLSNYYHRAYLFHGNTEKTITYRGKTITYIHSECFLGNSSYPRSINKFIKLTGDNADGTPLPVIKKNACILGNNKKTVLYVEENGIIYKITNKTCLDEEWLKDHYISGYDIIEATKMYNEYKQYCAAQTPQKEPFYEK